MGEIRVIKTDTIKDCYNEINIILNEANDRLTNIANTARMNGNLDNSTVVSVLTAIRDIKNSIREELLPIELVK